MGNIETSQELCLNPMVATAANAALENNCLPILDAALERVGKSSEAGRVSVDMMEQLCIVLEEHTAEKLPRKMQSFASNAANGEPHPCRSACAMQFCSISAD